MKSLWKQPLLFVLLAAVSGVAAGASITQTDSAAVRAKEAAHAPAGARKEVPVRDISSEWAALFHSPQLDALIKRAFSANPDAGAVQAALRRAQESPVIRRGFFYPAVAAGESGFIWAADAEEAVAKQDAGTDYYSIRSAQLTVGYVPEVLGAQPDRSGADQLQAGMQREASYFTLASNVVAAAIQEASVRALIEAQLNIVGLNRQSLEIVHNQLKLGYVSEEDVTLQELGAAEAQQNLVPLLQQLGQMHDLLRELAGTAPEEDVTEKFTLDALLLNRELPLNLPSRLVEQRPDVRMAEARLYAAGAQYGMRAVNTVPRFTITAASGDGDAASNWMLKAGGRFFDLKGNAAQTLFGKKTLRTQSLAARQVLEQAAEQYRHVVMAALQDVADTLNVIASDERALKAAAKVALAASKKGELMRKQYEAGSADFQVLLVAQQSEQLATINLVQAQSNRAGDSIALFQALGGRWWKREDTDLAGSDIRKLSGIVN